MVPWSRGYDTSFTPSRSQVRILPGPFLFTGVGSLLVEYVVANDVSWVRFPVRAFFYNTFKKRSRLSNNRGVRPQTDSEKIKMKTITDRLKKGITTTLIAVSPFVYNMASAQKPMPCQKYKSNKSAEINYKLNNFKNNLKDRLTNSEEKGVETKKEIEEPKTEYVYVLKQIKGIDTIRAKQFSERELYNFIKPDFPSESKYREIIQDLNKGKTYGNKENNLFEKGALKYPNKDKKIKFDTLNTEVILAKNVTLNKEFDRPIFGSDKLNIDYSTVVYIKEKKLMKEEFFKIYF